MKQPISKLDNVEHIVKTSQHKTALFWTIPMLPYIQKTMRIDLQGTSHTITALYESEMQKFINWDESASD